MSGARAEGGVAPWYPAHMKSVEAQVAGLTIDPVTNMPIVVLRDVGGRWQLPIWIGLVEASAIATQLENVKLARPMTHDLMRQMLVSTGTSLDRVEVTDLKEDTFFAAIHLTVNGKPVVLDSRPSDAIAMALRMEAPIFVAEPVLEASRRAEEASEPRSGGKPGGEAAERPRFADLLANNPPTKWREILENLSPEDFGKFKM